MWVKYVTCLIFVFTINTSFPSSSKYVMIFSPNMVRPANVPEGAHVEWEIELLGFEMPKVIYKYLFSCSRSKNCLMRLQEKPHYDNHSIFLRMLPEVLLLTVRLVLTWTLELSHC